MNTPKGREQKSGWGYEGEGGRAIHIWAPDNRARCAERANIIDIVGFSTGKLSLSGQKVHSPRRNRSHPYWLAETPWESLLNS